MYFPQPFPGKVRDLDWQSSFPLLTPPLSRASRALKKKKDRERRTTANKTTVWTVYSTDGDYGNSEKRRTRRTPQKDSGCAFNSLYSHCVRSRHTVAEGAVNGVALLPIVAPPCCPFPLVLPSPPGALFFDQLLFQNDRVWRYTACPIRMRRGGVQL